MKMGQVFIHGVNQFQRFVIYLKYFQLLFVICDLINNNIVTLEMVMINHKNLTS